MPYIKAHTLVVFPKHARVKPMLGTLLMKDFANILPGRCASAKEDAAVAVRLVEIAARQQMM